MSVQERYDSALLGILQNEAQIENFIDVFFSFLYRRTDFFRHLIFPKDKYGFRPGVAKKLILYAFKKYEALAADKNLKLKQSYERHLEEERTRTVVEDGPMEVVEEVVVSEPFPPITQCASHTEQTADDTGTLRSLPNEPPLVQAGSSNDIGTLAEVQDGSTNDTQQSGATKEIKVETDKDKGDNSDEDTDLSRLQKIYQANPESYNGAMRDNYCWSQSISDLDVRVKVPKFIKKGKDVYVEIGRKHLKVWHKGSTPGSEVVVVDGDLCWEIQKDESMWSLVPGEHVHINVEKIQERWWDALLEGEPKISVRKIDPSRPITDLGDEEQAKVEEMMFNERQKRLGLPQSHEQVSLEYVMSEKGNRMLLLGKYLYHLEKKFGGKEFWRCSNRSCKGRCHTMDGVVIKGPTAHSHEASTGDVEAKRIQKAIKRRAVDTDEPIASILRDTLFALEPSAQARLPKEETIKRTIRRYRRLPIHIQDSILLH